MKRHHEPSNVTAWCEVIAFTLGTLHEHDVYAQARASHFSESRF